MGCQGWGNNDPSSDQNRDGLWRGKNLVDQWQRLGRGFVMGVHMELKRG